MEGVWVYTDTLTRVSQNRPGLRPSEQRIADYVLATPAEANELTIGALSERTGVSVASVARFCNALGYSGYSEFRRELAATLSRRESERDKFGVSDADIAPEDAAHDVIAKIAFQEATAIQETAESLDTATLDAVVDAIVAAPRIDIYGSASSGLAAQDLQQKLHRIALTSFHWQDQHLALTSAAVLPAGSVAIGFSHSGLTLETSQALTLARKAGAVTVAVTNYPESPLGRQADLVLTTITRETRYRSGSMSSRMAQLAIVDFIFVRVAQRSYDTVFESLKATYGAVQAHRLPYDEPASAL